MEKPNLPGEALPRHKLFAEKMHIVDGAQKVVGFHDPDGNYFALEEGEELVHQGAEGSGERDTFIRKDGELIPFETWRQGK